MRQGWIRGITAVIMAGILGVAGLALSSPLGSLQDRFIHYGTVERPDGSFRRMSIDAASADQVQPDQSLPEGTTILMETWYSPERASTVFVKTKQVGFGTMDPFLPVSPISALRPALVVIAAMPPSPRWMAP